MQHQCVGVGILLLHSDMCGAQQILSTTGRHELSESRCRPFAETVGADPRNWGKGGSDTAPRVRHYGMDQLLQQSIAGMLSSTLTPSRSLFCCVVPLVKDTAGGHQCVALEQTFIIRGPVRGALPDFRIEQTVREGQRSASCVD